jgi:DNA-binding CsgD family transcriptional regulator
MREPIEWRTIALGSAALMGITAILGLLHGFDMLALMLEIIFFGTACFVVGYLLLIAFFSRIVSKRPFRTSIAALAVFYACSLGAVLTVEAYGKLPGRDVNSDVFILLLLTTLAIAWLLLIVFSKRKPADLLILLAGETAIRTETIVIEDLSLEEACDELSQTFGLTPRESEVLMHVARGKTAAAIAKELYISRDTVSSHTQHIYQKLQINSQDQLIELVDSQK